MDTAPGDDFDFIGQMSEVGLCVSGVQPYDRVLKLAGRQSRPGVLFILPENRHVDAMGFGPGLRDWKRR